jgi:hypothetical protein
MGEVNALNSLRNFCKARGALDHSAEYYTRSLALAQQIHDLRDQEQALGNLGNIHYPRGDWVENWWVQSLNRQVIPSIWPVGG